MDCDAVDFAQVTRSISKAVTDLFHFIILFGFVHLSFAATGTLLFGPFPDLPGDKCPTDDAIITVGSDASRLAP